MFIENNPAIKGHDPGGVAFLFTSASAHPPESNVIPTLLLRGRDLWKFFLIQMSINIRPLRGRTNYLNSLFYRRMTPPGSIALIRINNYDSGGVTCL
jgi:hypothetical protein